MVIKVQTIYKTTKKLMGLRVGGGGEDGKGHGTTYT